MDEEKTIEQETVENIEALVNIFNTKADALMEVDRKHLSEHDLEIEMTRLEHKFCVGVHALIENYKLNK